MKMSDLFDMEEYEQTVTARYIREQNHSQYPELIVSNYTESCTWEKAWTPITLSCRGLVYNSKTLEIIARPFAKFFNYGQEGAPEISLTDKVVVTEKVDGSMGVLYKTPNGAWAISTRGSFASEQAEWATHYFNEKYLDEKQSFSTEFGINHYEYTWEPDQRYTYIFEIIYPENRIVVDYGNKEGLVLLGVVDKETGKSHQPVVGGDTFGWPDEIVETYADLVTLADVIASEGRSNKEGYVVWHQESDSRVKIKHEEYMVLHRFMTNTSPKNIWEVLFAGQDPAEVFSLAPDEFHEWMRSVIEDLTIKFKEIENKAIRDFENIKTEISGDTPYTRADFARKAVAHSNSPILFKMLDDRPYDDIIWELIKPRGDEKMVLKPVDQDAN